MYKEDSNGSDSDLYPSTGVFVPQRWWGRSPERVPARGDETPLGFERIAPEMNESAEEPHALFVVDSEVLVHTGINYTEPILTIKIEGPTGPHASEPSNVQAQEREELVEVSDDTATTVATVENVAGKPQAATEDDASSHGAQIDGNPPTTGGAPEDSSMLGPRWRRRERQRTGRP